MAHATPIFVLVYHSPLLFPTELGGWAAIYFPDGIMENKEKKKQVGSLKPYPTFSEVSV